MPSHPNRVVRFFRELRRRRVFKTFAMYGATAFILMEAADIMFPRLGLPEWTVTFVIVLLIAGFPLALVLSWIFDVTPEGIQKTPGLEEVERSLNGESVIPSGKKGFTLSHAIILVLLVVVCILLYPRLFPGDQYREYRNEAGQVRLVVLPFENLTGDESMDWFSKGISSLLTNGLGTSDQLLVYNDQGLGDIMNGMKEVNTAGITGAQAREIAGKTRTQAYVTGSFQGRGNTYRILARLVSTENGDILFTSQVEGDLNSDSYLDLADSLCTLIRDQLEIRVMEQHADFDFRKAFTTSAEAYRYYIEGMNALVRTDFATSTELLEKAVEIDSNFAFAAFSLAMSHNIETASMSKAREWVALAHELKASLPLIYQQWIDLWYTCVFENDLTKLKRQVAALESSGIESRLFWYDMAITNYSYTGNTESAREDYEKVWQISEKLGDFWKFRVYYINYGLLLHKEDRHEEEEEVYRLALEYFTGDRDRKWFYYRQAVCALSQGDSVGAEKYIQDYYRCKVNLGEQEELGYLQGNILFDGKAYKRAEVEYRKFIREHPDHLNAKYWLARTLIEGELDQAEGAEITRGLLEKFPGNEVLLNLQAMGLSKRGRHKEALVILDSLDTHCLTFSLFRYRLMQEIRTAMPGG